MSDIKSNDEQMTYEKAGVSISRGEQFVTHLQNQLKNSPTFNNPYVKKGIGGFAALYSMGQGRYLAAATDGVGTKLKLAQTLNTHDTIGIDLVAMCANDLLCVGARPLFFLDYFATSELNLEQGKALMKGIIKGCELAQMPLIGGETAEMPGLYQKGDYDLAGFCIGEVYEEQLLKPENIKVGDTLVALPSSGPHSNGYSLIRKLVDPSEKELLKDLLTPTRIYSSSIIPHLNKWNHKLKGMAHITGGGIHNIERLNESVGYSINYPTNESKIPQVFNILQKRGRLSQEEMFKTFNMGIGLVLITDDPELIMKDLTEIGENPFILGKVTSTPGIHLKNS